MLDKYQRPILKCFRDVCVRVCARKEKPKKKKIIVCRNKEENVSNGGGIFFFIGIYQKYEQVYARRPNNNEIAAFDLYFVRKQKQKFLEE